jgi:hypothetical protein
MHGLKRESDKPGLVQPLHEEHSVLPMCVALRPRVACCGECKGLRATSRVISHVRREYQFLRHAIDLLLTVAKAARTYD